MMRYWRDASSLIIAARTAKTKSHGSSYNLQHILPTSKLQHVSSTSDLNKDTKTNDHRHEDYKILTLKRNAASSFMPSNLVFPGGTVQDVDRSKQWLDLFQAVTSSGATTQKFNACFHNTQPPVLSKNLELEIDKKMAMRICAIRETFEESGILIAIDTNNKFANEDELLKLEYSIITERSSFVQKSKRSLESWRLEIGNESCKFLEMCNELKVVPNIWALYEWRNWLTPVFKQVLEIPTKPSRFDTVFYICCFDCETLPKAVADDTETFHPEWRSPSEYIQLDRRNALSGKLPVPQTYELEYLSQFRELQILNSYCIEHSKNGLPRWMPVYIKCTDGRIMLLPGDYLYPSDPDFEGTKDIPTTNQVTVSELTDNSRNLHRIVYNNSKLENGIIMRQFI